MSAPGLPRPRFDSWLLGRGALPLPLVLVVTLALLCVPVLIDLLGSPRSGPFRYVAADAFYYLTVARNFARTGLLSFDGETTTNGFHPLWQLTCGALYFVCDLCGLEEHAVLLVVLSGLGLIAVALVLLGRAFAANDRLSAAFCTVPFGLYAVAIAPSWLGPCFSEPGQDYWVDRLGRFPLFGTLWSYANGMESGLVLFWFAALAYLRVARPPVPGLRSASTFGLAAAGLTLSRLDHVLLALPLVLAFALRMSDRRAKASVLVAFGAPIASYVLFSHLALGSALPVSGSFKSSFPYFSAAHLYHLTALFSSPDCSTRLAFVWREAQLFLPIVAAFVYLVLSVRVTWFSRGVGAELRPSVRQIDHFLVPAAIGIVLLGSYNLLFVDSAGQGHWYFPVSTLFVSLAAVALIQRLPALPVIASVALLVISSAAGVLLYAKLGRRPDYHVRLAAFYWEEAPRIRAHYGTALPKLIEFDDGIVGFSLDMPTLSSALMLDAEGMQARREQRLLRLAVERGFDRMATLVYRPHIELDAEHPDAALARPWAESLARGLDTSFFDFSFDYVSSDGDFAIVRLKPKLVSQP